VVSTESVSLRHSNAATIRQRAKAVNAIEVPTWTLPNCDSPSLMMAEDLLNSAQVLSLSVGGRSRPRPGRQMVTTLATAVTKNSWPISISRTARLCPGLAAGTRVPYPVVVRVVNEKYRSWEKVPSPATRRTGRLPACPAPGRRTRTTSRSSGRR
jgi:hypothetical protein